MTGFNLTDTFGNSSSSGFGNTNALGITPATDPFATNTSPLGLGGNPFPTTTAAPPVSANPTTGVTDTSGLSGVTSSAGSAVAGTAPASGLGSALSSLGSGVSSLLNSPLGSLAELGGLYAIISGQANNTQQQNNALAQQISNIGQPSLTAGTQELGAYTSGNLTAPFQGQANAALDQIQKNATSQEQQVAQMLANSGGQNQQSAQISQTSQIEQQKQLADQTAVSNAFIAELNSSLQLTATGGGYVQSGIMQEIQSNTALQQQLSSLMGDLAKAYAQQTASSGTGTGAAAGGALSSITSLLGKAGSAIGSGVSSLLGGAGSAAGAVGSGLVAGAAPTAIGGITGDALGLSAAGAGVAGLAGAAPAAVDLAAVTDIGTSIGASAGGLGGAAGADAGAAGAGAAGGGIGLAGALGIGAAGALAVDLLGNQFNWFGNNSASSVTNKTLNVPSVAPAGNSVAVPQGSVVQWQGTGSSGRIIGTAQGGTTLAMQATYGHDPGAPVIYPPGGNAYTGTGGYVLNGFHKGAGQNLSTATFTNQQTGKTVAVSDPQFQQLTGITPQQLSQMYQMLTSQYKQGKTG